MTLIIIELCLFQLFGGKLLYLFKLEVILYLTFKMVNIDPRLRLKENE